MIYPIRADNRQARRRAAREERAEEDAALKAGPGVYERYAHAKQMQSATARRAQCAAKVAARIAEFIAGHVPLRLVRFSGVICPVWYMALWATLFRVPVVIDQWGCLMHWPRLLRAGLWGLMVGILALLALVFYTPAAWLAEQVRHWGYYIRRDEYRKPDGTHGLIRLRIRTWFWRRVVDEQEQW